MIGGDGPSLRLHQPHQRHTRHPITSTTSDATPVPTETSVEGGGAEAELSAMGLHGVGGRRYIGYRVWEEKKRDASDYQKIYSVEVWGGSPSDSPQAGPLGPWVL